MSTVVRKAQKEDLRRMTALWVQLTDYHHAIDKRHWRRAKNGSVRSRAWMEEALTDAKRVIFVAEESGKVIGFTHGALKEGPPVLRPRLSGFITDRIVDKTCRGKGIGSRLLYRIESWFAAQGAEDATLFAAVRNLPTLVFYEKNSFEPWVTTMWKPLPKRPPPRRRRDGRQDR